ncbi:hypothetical protein ACLMJK_004225 [Lecanora helva]
MAAKAWFPVPANSQFSLANIPFGIISTEGSNDRHVAVAIGDQVVDLTVFASFDGFSGLPAIQPHLDVFSQPVLNHFASLGRPIHRKVREYLREVFTEGTEVCQAFKKNPIALRGTFPLKDVQTHLPFRIGDYTDFYVGKYHAQNAGKFLLGKENALPPNYMHLPLGYHGRASSVVVSGTPIRRPRGQIIEDPAASSPRPVFSASKRLDFELELGAFLCKANKMGEPVDIKNAEENIFGFVLLNDWSARDIQGWEMMPLGPFNAKNFGTSISPWVVLADALEPFKTSGIENEGVLSYLQEMKTDSVYDLQLEVELTTKSGTSTTITRTNGKNLLFSFPQMLAHHTVGGCPMQVGDLLGSGTVSGTDPSTTSGSMFELSANGKNKIRLSGQEERTFLEDYDLVKLKGWAGKTDKNLVGFGDCIGTVQPALTP